jgi:hypothetical protein
MTSPTFEQLRIPVAIGLLAVALFVLWPRGGEGSSAGDEASPSQSITLGGVGGAVLATPTLAPTPTPTEQPSPTPEVTPAPPDTFTAELLACQELDGSRCRGEFDTFPRRARSFTALVRFEDARAGDTISVALTGPGVAIDGGPFTLDGGGDGYYYSEITMGNLPDGDYILVATRNGTEVARITLRRD